MCRLCAQSDLSRIHKHNRPIELCYDTNIICVTSEKGFSLERLLLIAKAFSDINRLRIVALIEREEELCVCEISDTLSIAQPLVSRHLKQLKQAGILQSQQKGKWHLYMLQQNPSALIRSWLDALKPYRNDLEELVTCSRT